ncbi:MAG TPA: hypothetical protein PKX28_10515 [Candidatus Hydrogenedentes bacterium]|nr:hypothetical protein [Candidatus Hydrogenedentota bacterium]HOJ67276.1 hypothetical protein [Candidatus Hydrogenedentota bacterium]HOK89126.1 hypothetical protein [Candidatus Hydrogenedentota bacterium]HOV61108.1 hypothetical protein [Candidatus Hydrogenedentota bacterium]HPO31668.1 hypothetical protein [Candidatus Hydrogenedentota bacterium]
MLKDRMVRVKLVRRFKEQRPQSYVGKVTGFSEGWVLLEGKLVLVSRNIPGGAQVDAQKSIVMIPRDNIESIQLLPDTFNLDKITVNTEGQQLRLDVPGGTPCYIGEMGEG